MKEAVQKQREEARAEKPFSAEELMQQITVLLNEYLIGDFECKNGEIICKFLNGQSFAIRAEMI